MMEIAIDFDGTVVTHEYPKIGRSIGAATILNELIANGHRLILYTMRSGEHLEEAIAWFKEEDIPLYGIQCNPTQKSWTDSPKCYAQLYIDDAALGCPTIFNSTVSSRPFVDWARVAALLRDKRLIGTPMKPNALLLK